MKVEKLGNLCQIVIGRTPSRSIDKYWGKGHKWVSISDMKGKVIYDTKEEITDEALKEIRCRKIEKDTLMMSFKLSVGKLAFAGCDLYTNEAIAALEIKDKSKIYPEYLFYALKVTPMIGGNRAVKGITLNSKSLADLRIPLPPLEEQIQIATVLSKAENLIAKRKESIELLDEFVKSTFLEMFGDPVRNEKGWERNNFGSVIEILTDYHANGSYEILRDHVTLKKEPDYALMVRTTDLEKNDFSGDCNYIDEKTYNFLERSKVFGGEIIINKIGSAGKVYLMPKLNRPTSLGMNAFLLRFNENANNLYVYHLLVSDYGKNSIEKRVKGAVTKTITKEAVRGIEIPIPPLSLQNEFAEIVNRVEVLKEKYQKSLEELENLYGSLSQRAFRG
ncbi:MAG TPA: restriction endonuclease subunit S [bacterium]|nr:restriction endonuclease subunit S [bacterium]HQN72785.1 restriction endonuclease subunit S [bacterium]